MRSGCRRFLQNLTVVLVLCLAGRAEAVEIIGHRGASHDAPENTLAAARLAWRRNAGAVEIDVRLSRDGRIVAVHDETTKRYGGPDRKVAGQTLAELKSLDVGRWKDEKWTGERIPTLSELLQTVPEGRRLLIEIKCGPEILPELEGVLKRSDRPPRQTALIGFSFETMQAAKRRLPRRKVYWVVKLERQEPSGRWSPPLRRLIAKARRAGFDGLDLGNAPAVIDRAFVQQVKQSGLELYVWTVNDEREALRLKDAGVDGITTDRPGRLRSRLKGRGHEAVCNSAGECSCGSPAAGEAGLLAGASTSARLFAIAGLRAKCLMRPERAPIVSCYGRIRGFVSN